MQNAFARSIFSNEVFPPSLSNVPSHISYHVYGVEYTASGRKLSPCYLPFQKKNNNNNNNNNK